jgi:hypothetical protein
MKYRITSLIRTDSGTYNESRDILPDLLDGGECPENMAELLYWLFEEGYRPTKGFKGWGTVVMHGEIGHLLNITETE